MDNEFIKIDANREKFIALLKTIDKPQDAVNDLIKYLDGKHFFESPFSSYEGYDNPGDLCKHALNTLTILKKLSQELVMNFTDSELIVVALLSDINKANLYEFYPKNVKKENEFGKYEWVTETAVRVKDSKDRMVLGNSGENAVFIISLYFNLTMNERAAILNHIGDSSPEYRNYDSFEINRRFPLATLLQSANLISTFITDNEI